MDERRDLVDRKELRRQINADANGRDDTPWRSGWCSGQFHAIKLLDAMPAVECPRGWTRDEVLAELAKHPDNVCEGQNIYTGEWVALARELIDQWRPEVSRFDVRVVRSTPDPEWVPLTKLVGRTIHGETEPVDRIEWATKAGTVECRARWRWHERGCLRWQDFPDGTLNLDDATVAVRPEATT